jgi:hypothetical protein
VPAVVSIADLRSRRWLEPPQGQCGLATGFAPLDALSPGGAFALGSVHEFLSETDTPAGLLPILVARAAAEKGWVVWCDTQRRFYPPAAAALGLPLERVLLLQPSSEREALWAATEALRCGGVSACVLPIGQLSPLQARRLQLAAERGGGVGLLLRPARSISRPYSARTRWLVRPALGERSVQRVRVQLIHGHGGRLGEDVLLEVCRDTHHVRAIVPMAGGTQERQTAASA